MAVRSTRSEETIGEPLYALGRIGPDRPQYLIRQVSGPRGWTRRTEYELRWHPHGRTAPAEWVRVTRSPHSVDGVHFHTSDWPDIRKVIRAAWDRGDDRLVAV